MKSSASKNYIYNTLYKVLTMLTPLITAPFLARVIGKESIGVFSFTYTIAYNFSLFAKLGLVNYGSREIARSRDDREKMINIFSQIFSLQIITSVVVTVVYYCFVIFFEHDYKTIFLINGLYVLSIAIDIDWLFYGLENFRLVSIRNAVVKIVTVILILVFVKKENGLMTYVIIMIASDLLRFVSIWIGYSKNTKFIRQPIKAVFSHFKPMFILFIPVIATSVYRSMDKIMLGALSDMGQTGLYDYSERIVYMLLGFVTSLEIVMMPRISNMLQKGDKEEALKNIHVSMTFVCFLTAAMAFGISGVTERFIPLFYGEEFSGCVEFLPPLAMTLMLIGWANVIRTQYIMPHGKDHIYVISTILGAIVNLAVNWALIPKMGAKGAIVGTIAAEICVACYLTAIVRKELPILKYLKSTFTFPIIGVLMYFVVNLIGRHIENVFLSLFVQIATGAVLYIALSLVSIYFLQPDLFNKLKSLFTKLLRRFSK